MIIFWELINFGTNKHKGKNNICPLTPLVAGNNKKKTNQIILFVFWSLIIHIKNET